MHQTLTCKFSKSCGSPVVFLLSLSFLYDVVCCSWCCCCWAVVVLDDHLEPLVATVCVRMTWSEPPGTCAWNTSSWRRCRWCWVPSGAHRSRESTTCAQITHHHSPQPTTDYRLFGHVRVGRTSRWGHQSGEREIVEGGGERALRCIVEASRN